MKKKLNRILPGILLVAIATPGFAENRQGAVTVSPFFGGYVLDDDQREESRPMFGLRAGYNFTKSLGAEAMFGYSLTETKREYGLREADMYRYGLDFLYHFMPDGTFVPFLAVGGGGTSFTISDTPSAENHYAGLVNYGGGIKYFVADNVALRADVRHVLLVNDTGRNNLEYSVGLTFQFGGAKKAIKATPAAVAVIKDNADTTLPTVVFTAPVNGSTSVYANQKVSVAFSEDMDPATITGETFTLKQEEKLLSGKLITNGSTATFIPANNFEQDKPYNATVTTGARDLAGNRLAQNHAWRFTTGQAADSTAPTVTFTSPVAGASAAPVNQNVNVAFSENMDPATMTAETFFVKEGKTPVAGKVQAAASTATFIPAKNLEKGKAYTATVTTGTRDLAGNQLAREYTWDFNAYTAPKVVGVLATLENSHFDYNSAAISENGKTILNHNIKTLTANPGMKLRISGYASAAGSEDYNQKLSERRAAAVKEYLVKEGGIDGKRLASTGYGEKSPAQHEADPSDKLSGAALANMRVILEVIE